MRSRMTPEQATKMQARTGQANAISELAIAANGLGVSRADKDKANKVLEDQLGKRKMAKVKEEALRRSGAGRKGLRDLFS